MKNVGSSVYQFRGRTIIFFIVMFFSFSGSVFSHQLKGHAEPSEMELEIKMKRLDNYMSERCITIPARKVVEYEFESEYKVSFNIHFHTEVKTEFLEKKDELFKYSGKFTSLQEQEYCFTWSNKGTSPAKERWFFSLQYAVTNI